MMAGERPTCLLHEGRERRNCVKRKEIGLASSSNQDSLEGREKGFQFLLL